VDTIVAAIAIKNGCEEVVTRNDVHFRWIEEVSGL
jgi:predicted nucleic acid-binding protein